MNRRPSTTWLVIHDTSHINFVIFFGGSSRFFFGSYGTVVVYMDRSTSIMGWLNYIREKSTPIS